jgi:hypothetical protein
MKCSACQAYAVMLFPGGICAACKEKEPASPPPVEKKKCVRFIRIDILRMIESKIRVRMQAEDIHPEAHTAYLESIKIVQDHEVIYQ